MKPTNFFHCSKGRGIVHKVAFTGVFLGLVLLLQFLSRFMPFADTYIKLNLSLLFILPIFYYAGPLWGILVLILRLTLGPAISGLGYTIQEFTGHFILFMCSMITIGLMYIFSGLFSKMKLHNVKVILIVTSTLLTTSLILTFLNQVLFTPLFWSAFKFTDGFSLKQSIKLYDNPIVKAKFFMIPNYWAGTFATYLAGNLVKYGIIFMCYIPMSKVLRSHITRNNKTWN
ncbi:MPN527 family putative ECF transporter permease subunit [Mycoplasma todarodis]|uniref:MPN527 family putative ECF transporter permease subunit n=1 Tax=Mycoplasma todarodis TaxID=1937191 RepID=UPI003B3053F2